MNNILKNLRKEIEEHLIGLKKDIDMNAYKCAMDYTKYNNCVNEVNNILIEYNPGIVIIGNDKIVQDKVMKILIQGDSKIVEETSEKKTIEWNGYTIKNYYPEFNEEVFEKSELINNQNVYLVVIKPEPKESAKTNVDLIAPLLKQNKSICIVIDDSIGDACDEYVCQLYQELKDSLGINTLAEKFSILYLSETHTDELQIVLSKEFCGEKINQPINTIVRIINKFCNTFVDEMLDQKGKYQKNNTKENKCDLVNYEFYRILNECKYEWLGLPDLCNKLFADYFNSVCSEIINNEGKDTKNIINNTYREIFQEVRYYLNESVNCYSMGYCIFREMWFDDERCSIDENQKYIEFGSVDPELVANRVFNFSAEIDYAEEKYDKREYPFKPFFPNTEIFDEIRTKVFNGDLNNNIEAKVSRFKTLVFIEIHKTREKMYAFYDKYGKSFWSELLKEFENIYSSYFLVDEQIADAYSIVEKNLMFDYYISKYIAAWEF